MSGIFALTVFVAGFIGWVMNIVTIATTFTELTGLMIIRIVGIFIAPLGAVLGYL
jgi:hypothetical protein